MVPSEAAPDHAPRSDPSAKERPWATTQRTSSASCWTRRTGSDSWTGGTVYNPQDGRIYSGDMTMLSGTSLRVRAYLGVPFLGESQIWTRAERTAAGIMEYNCRFVRVPPVPKQLAK